MRFQMRSVLSVFLLLSFAIGRVPADDKKVLAPSERKQLADLLAEYRKQQGNTDERFAVIDKIALLGPLALPQIEELAAKEMQKGLNDYRAQFTRAATGVFAKKAADKQLAEIGELRAKVLELATHPDLSKEQIIGHSDPALARLKELLLVDREEILAQGKNLAKPRSVLLKQGLEWDYCRMKARERVPAAEIPQKPQAKESPAPPGEQPAVLFADYLIQEEELALASAMPMDPETRQTLSGNAQLSSKLDPEEARCILDANLIRCLLGLKALAIDPGLVMASRGHSADMRKLNFFAHDSPVAGKTTPWERAKLAGTTGSAENIAFGTRDGIGTSRMWWHSPGHHKNMLGEHLRIGVGRDDTHWTQMFGK